MSENNIKKIREYCKENIEENKKDKLKFFLQIILIVTGLIHIIFASYLKEKLSIITGITTINIALIRHSILCCIKNIAWQYILFLNKTNAVL